MRSLDLARRNLRRNLGDYGSYLACLVFVMAAFFLFAAILENPQFKEAGEVSSKIQALFKVSSWVVAAFGLVFTWTSAGFFLRRRSKELATWALLGMTRRKAARILLLENLALGGLALAAGSLVGALLARLAFEALVALMRLPLEVGFSLSPRAFLLGGAAFALILLPAAARSWLAARATRLVELFRAEREAEAPPRGGLLVALAAVLLLGGAYATAMTVDWRGVVRLMLHVLVATIAGTYCLFAGLLPAVFRLLRRNRALWLRGPNLVALSQLAARVRRNARMLGTIAVLDAVSLCALATTASLYSTGYASVERTLEFAWELEGAGESELRRAEEILRASGVGPAPAERFLLLAAEARPAAGGAGAAAGTPVPPGEARPVHLMSYSAYRARLEGRAARGWEPQRPAARAGLAALEEPAEGEALLVDKVYSSRPEAGKEGSRLVLPGLPGAPSLLLRDRGDDGVIALFRSRPLLVLGDGAWAAAAAALPPEARISVAGIQAESPRGASSTAATAALRAALPEGVGLAAYSDQEAGFYADSGLLLFIGVFLCVLFFLASCATLGFKLLVDSAEDASRHRLLARLGLSVREARRGLSLQLGLVFAMPLALALVHGAFAMRMLSLVLEGSIVLPVLATAAGYLVFALAFHRLTLESYLSSMAKAAAPRRG